MEDFNVDDVGLYGGDISREARCDHNRTLPQDKLRGNNARPHAADKLLILMFLVLRILTNFDDVTIASRLHGRLQEL